MSKRNPKDGARQQTPATPAPVTPAATPAAPPADVAAQQAATPAATPAAPVRVTQNGVKQHGPGKCADVWDYCTAQYNAAGKVPPTVAQVKKHAATHNWNVNNAQIEYYLWRKFMGISGRVAAPQQAPQDGASQQT